MVEGGLAGRRPPLVGPTGAGHAASGADARPRSPGLAMPAPPHTTRASRRARHQSACEKV